jgi:DNA-binding transcriptional regulator YdaS (Cro superfamily)
MIQVMHKTFTPDDRRRLAELVHVHPATLYQALTGKGAGFAPAECVRIEHDSAKELMRWHLRPNDWFLIWPELIGAEGAPKVPKQPSKKRKPAHREHATANGKPAPTDKPTRGKGQ